MNEYLSLTKEVTFLPWVVFLLAG